MLEIAMVFQLTISICWGVAVFWYIIRGILKNIASANYDKSIIWEKINDYFLLN